MIALLLWAHLALADSPVESDITAPDGLGHVCACEVPPEPELTWAETAWASKEEAPGLLALLLALITPYRWASTVRAVQEGTAAAPGWLARWLPWLVQLLPGSQVREAVQGLLASRASAPVALTRESLAHVNQRLAEIESKGLTDAEREVLLALAVLLDPTLPDEELRRRLGLGRAG